MDLRALDQSCIDRLGAYDANPDAVFLQIITQDFGYPHKCMLGAGIYSMPGQADEARR